jgi:GNAT superfamily N-acetyltransferase
MRAITYRELAPAELGRVAEIDRSELIPAIYLQKGAQLTEEAHEFDVPPWSAEGDHEHSLAYQIAFCERHLAAGGTAVGAFDGRRLVGIGIVTPHVRPGVAQLAYLQVSDGYRGQSVGRRLCEWMDDIARAAGDTAMVVSATPSVNTVRFYMGRGFAPTAAPLPELYELEPEDVHLSKRL